MEDSGNGFAIQELPFARFAVRIFVCTPSYSRQIAVALPEASIPICCSSENVEGLDIVIPGKGLHTASTECMKQLHSSSIVQKMYLLKLHN